MKIKINSVYSYALAATFLVAGFIFTVRSAHAYNPLYYTANQNGSVPAQQDSRGGGNPSTATIINQSPAGGSNMFWKTSSNVSWLTVTPSCHGTTGCGNAGSVAPGASDTVTVSPNTTNLAQNSYVGTVTVNGYIDAAMTTPSNPATVTITVNYTVSAPLPCNIAVSSTYNGTPNTLPPGGFNYTLTGPSTINGTNMTGATPWQVTAGTTWTMNATPLGNTQVTGYAPAQNQTCATSGSTITFTASFTDNPPNPPSSPGAANTSIDSTVACTHIKLNWGAATGATDYYLYRSTSTGTPTSSGNPWVDTASTGTTYDYVPPSSDPAYYYWVAAKNIGGTSSLSGPTAQVAPTPCMADFSASNKVLTKINAVNYPFNSPIGCIGNQAGTLPNTIRTGDKVSWSLNVCNQGNLSAINVVLTDTLTDLSPIAGSYILTTSPPTTSSSITPTPGGTCATGSCTLTFNIGNIPSGHNAIITFDSNTLIPVGTTQTLNRFRNQASFVWAVSGNSADNLGCTGHGSTSTNPCVMPDPGYIVFFNGPKAPTQTETHP